MKSFVLAVVILLVCACGFFILNNQNEQREAADKWSQFLHKEDGCQAAKKRTLDMKRHWLNKDQRPSADDEALWKSQESQACGQ